MNFIKILFNNFYDYTKIPLSILSLDKELLFTTIQNLDYLRDTHLAKFPDEANVIRTVYTIDDHAYATFRTTIDGAEYNILVGPKFLLDPSRIASNPNINLHFEESRSSFKKLAKLIFQNCNQSASFTLTEEKDLDLNLSDLLQYKVEMCRIGKLTYDNATDYLLIQSYLLQFIVDGDYSNAMSFLNKFIESLFDNLSTSRLQSIKYNVVILLVLLARLTISSGSMGTLRMRTMTETYIREVDSLTNENDVFIFLRKVIANYIKEIHAYVDYSSNTIKAIQYINNHLYDKFTISDIADHLDLSLSYLTTLFKQETGESLKTYTQKRLMNEAKMLLEHTDFPIHDIAKKLHFYSSAYFGKIFKKYVGMTPKEYRKLNTVFL